MTINGVTIPPTMFGRAFPYKDFQNQFEGPANIDGKIYRMVIWKNTNTQGREYIRIAFEEWQEPSV